MNLPEKCLIDTNVPITANRMISPENISEELISCVPCCISAIEHIIKSGIVVIDDNFEIISEYAHKLSRKGQPGMGDRFFKWINDNQFNQNKVERIAITQIEEDQYKEFPQHPGLKNFDLSDRKFVAVTNAHAKKPPILQATDSKWWGWKDALAETGIEVIFLCEDYVKKKYKKKFPDGQ